MKEPCARCRNLEEYLSFFRETTTRQINELASATTTEDSISARIEERLQTLVEIARLARKYARHRVASKSGVPGGSRTRVTGVKGRCPGPLDDRDVQKRAQKRAHAHSRGR